jgi:hypothetical protein
MRDYRDSSILTLGRPPGQAICATLRWRWEKTPTVTLEIPGGDDRNWSNFSKPHRNSAEQSRPSEQSRGSIEQIVTPRPKRRPHASCRRSKLVSDSSDSRKSWLVPMQFQIWWVSQGTVTSSCSGHDDAAESCSGTEALTQHLGEKELETPQTWLFQAPGG